MRIPSVSRQLFVQKGGARGEGDIQYLGRGANIQRVQCNPDELVAQSRVEHAPALRPQPIRPKENHPPRPLDATTIRESHTETTSAANPPPPTPVFPAYEQKRETEQTLSRLTALEISRLLYKLLKSIFFHIFLLYEGMMLWGIFLVGCLCVCLWGGGGRSQRPPQAVDDS